MTPTEAIIELQKTVIKLQDVVLDLQKTVYAQGEIILDLQRKLFEKKAVDIIMPKLESAMKAKEN